MFEQNVFDEEVIFKNSIKYLLVSAILLFVLFYKNISVPLGLTFGGIASLVNFRIMIYSMHQMINKGFVNKLSYSAFYILRMMVIIIIITAAIKLESINLVAAVIGLLWVKIVIFGEALYSSLRSK